MDGNAPSGRVLVACSLDSEEVLRNALDPLGVRILRAFTHDEAKAHLDAGIDVVVCSLRFDESRMLDFIAEIARERPRLPVVCCHVSGKLREASLRAAFTAAGHLGAVAVVDFPEADRAERTVGANAELRAAVVANLSQDVGHASMS
jgi:DNA-binding NtrC family response regulator